MLFNEVRSRDDLTKARLFMTGYFKCFNQLRLLQIMIWLYESTAYEKKEPPAVAGQTHLNFTRLIVFTSPIETLGRWKMK
jgi:hypothetical protein